MTSADESVSQLADRLIGQILSDVTTLSGSVRSRLDKVRVPPAAGRARDQCNPSLSTRGTSGEETARYCEESDRPVKAVEEQRLLGCQQPVSSAAPCGSVLDSTWTSSAADSSVGSERLGVRDMVTDRGASGVAKEGFTETAPDSDTAREDASVRVSGTVLHQLIDKDCGDFGARKKDESMTKQNLNRCTENTNDRAVEGAGCGNIKGVSGGIKCSENVTDVVEGRGSESSSVLVEKRDSEVGCDYGTINAGDGVVITTEDMGGDNEYIRDRVRLGNDRRRDRVGGWRRLWLCGPTLTRMKRHRTISVVGATPEKNRHPHYVSDVREEVSDVQLGVAGCESSYSRPCALSGSRCRTLGERMRRVFSHVLQPRRQPPTPDHYDCTGGAASGGGPDASATVFPAGSAAETPSQRPRQCISSVSTIGTADGCNVSSVGLAEWVSADVSNGGRAAEDSADDEDHDDDVEMLGITEGWGPVQDSPVGSNRDSLAPTTDFVSVIEKVKDRGWYWGPISRPAAEQILQSEPDGSFIVRDSGDDRYIFSLTFRLCGMVRHVRIEHDNGKFSFGGAHRFGSSTIVDFIENAVDYSRSGRYLFFLHRRPVHGPTRVQLLHPVSRFSHVQSLRHLVRFSILKLVRRDHIDKLPLPKSLLDYLKSPHYMSEKLETDLS